MVTEPVQPIVSSLLKGRVTCTPLDSPKRWRVTGKDGWSRFFRGRARLVLASPTGNYLVLEIGRRFDRTAA
jgi:hypothetical protein